MQVIKSLQRTLKEGDYFNTCENIQKLFEFHLGYEFVKEHDPSLAGVNDIPRITPTENVLVSLKEPNKIHITIPFDLTLAYVRDNKCCHYRNPSTEKPEGVICRISYEGIYPDKLRVQDVVFGGYGERWKSNNFWNILRKEEPVSDCFRENLNIPPEVKTIERMTTKMFLKRMNK